MTSDDESTGHSDISTRLAELVGTDTGCVTLNDPRVLDLLPRQTDIDRVLTHGMVRFPFMFMYRLGEPLSVDSYTTGVSLFGERHDGFLDHRMAVELIESGCVLEVLGMSHWNPSCRALSSTWLDRVPAAAEASYIALPPKGFHHSGDTGSGPLVVVQLTGETQWTFPTSADSGIRDVAGATLGPGAIAYIASDSGYEVATTSGTRATYMAIGLSPLDADELFAPVVDRVTGSRLAGDNPLDELATVRLASDILAHAKDITTELDGASVLTELLGRPDEG